jgi:hypothetical protein
MYHSKLTLFPNVKFTTAPHWAITSLGGEAPSSKNISYNEEHSKLETTKCMIMMLTFTYHNKRATECVSIHKKYEPAKKDIKVYTKKHTNNKL